MSNAQKLLISAIAVGLVILLWFVTGHYGLMSRLLLPPLGEIGLTAEELWTDGYVHVPLWQHVAVSLGRALVAFAAAIVSGIPIGLLMGMFPGVNAALDPFAYALEAIPTDDPDGAAILPDRDDYYANLPRGTVVFTGDLTLKVGDHTFHCLWTPGHTPGQLAVHVPEERAVFTGDTIFSEVQTWLMTSNVDQWLEALERIRALDVDYVVPGHGPVQSVDYVMTQRAVLMTWKATVADAVAKGWSREETIAQVRFDRKFGPVDVGQGYMMDHIQNNNAGSLWDKLSATGYAKGR
jgi:glyoxylase-like metal-dependent hydrolase (beta-lactamase superfamily II)